jgi:FkbM family methyltransferase|tara:strand:+ start:2766 stop:3449 length:684 start_codon:yes stop_codon:yes gene_type:complete
MKIPSNKLNEYYDYVSKNWIWILPSEQIKVLQQLKHKEFKPKVIFDIGANFLHWYRPAQMMFPESKFYCFEAYPKLEDLYKKNKVNYFINVLSNKDNRKIRFYYNEIHAGGNSYYQINPKYSKEFSKDKYLELNTITLDSLVKKNKLNSPDMIKIDVQGAELDILEGATETLKNVEYVILELQHANLNMNAPLAQQVISYMDLIGFNLELDKYSDNGLDADYLFKKK